MRTSLFFRSASFLMIAFFAGAMVICVPGFSQKPEGQSEEYQTLFGQNMSYGGYGVFSLGYSQFAGYDAIVTGGRGVFLIDHSLGIGFGGTGFVADLAGSSVDEYWTYLGGGYGGLLIEPVLFGMKPIHVAFPIMVGGGAITVNGSSNGYDYYYNSIDRIHSMDEFVVVEPGVELELNITRFFRLAIGGSYRFTSKVSVSEYEWSPISATPTLVESPVITNKNLNNFNVNISFKFGKF